MAGAPATGHMVRPQPWLAPYNSAPCVTLKATVMVETFLILIGLQLLGEWLSLWLALPIPGPVLR